MSDEVQEPDEAMADAAHLRCWEVSNGLLHALADGLADGATGGRQIKRPMIIATIAIALGRTMAIGRQDGEAMLAELWPTVLEMAVEALQTQRRMIAEEAEKAATDATPVGIESALASLDGELL